MEFGGVQVADPPGCCHSVSVAAVRIGQQLSQGSRQVGDFPFVRPTAQRPAIGVATRVHAGWNHDVRPVFHLDARSQLPFAHTVAVQPIIQVQPPAPRLADHGVFDGSPVLGRQLSPGVHAAVARVNVDYDKARTRGDTTHVGTGVIRPPCSDGLRVGRRLVGPVGEQRDFIPAA